MAHSGTRAVREHVQAEGAFGPVEDNLSFSAT
jgi:hypothetical protein